MLKKKELTPAQINALPKSARPINVEPLSPEEMARKYADRVRRKKTERELVNKKRNKSDGS